MIQYESALRVELKFAQFKKMGSLFGGGKKRR